MKKSKILIVFVIAIMLVGLMCSFTGCKKSDEAFNPNADWVDVSSVNVDMAGKYYVGTEGSFDLKKGFGDATFEVDSSKASISGTMLTVNGQAGDSFGLKVGGKTYTTTIVEGVNIVDEEGMDTAIADDKNLIIQCNLELKLEQKKLTSDIYGNGYTINAHGIVGVDDKGEEVDYINKKNGGTTLFDVKDSVNIQDCHFTGKVFDADATTGLTSLTNYGAFINAWYDANVGDMTINVKHCLIENSAKMIFVSGVDLNVTNCIMRNAADNGICSANSAERASTVTVKDIVMENMVDACILTCGWTKGTLYDTINLEGYVDLYNWKETQNCKLMPDNEQFADTVNKMVVSETEKSTYASFFTYATVNGEEKKYIHCGIIVLATGKFSANKATINGSEEHQFVKRGFPIPSFAKLVAKTCEVVGYEKDTYKDIVGPTSRFNVTNYTGFTA